jgi:hypothetical protein
MAFAALASILALSCTAEELSVCIVALSCTAEKSPAHALAMLVGRRSLSYAL